MHVEWRLFLYVSVDPLDGLAVFIEAQTHTPVLPDGPLEAHVEPQFPFNVRVDHPV